MRTSCSRISPREHGGERLQSRSRGTATRSGRCEATATERSGGRGPSGDQADRPRRCERRLGIGRGEGPTVDGLGTFLIEKPAGEPVPALDVTRKVARLDLDGRDARRVGPAGDQTAIWRQGARRPRTSPCVRSWSGRASGHSSLAVEYAKVRVQFDRPIATFQVIKHKAADMLHKLELSRVATHYAAWASDADSADRERAAAMAKGYVAEAANLVTAECIQIHGGVGFTWDVDCHLLYRRAKQDDLLFGAQGYQRERLADLLLGPVRQARS